MAMWSVNTICSYECVTNHISLLLPLHFSFSCVLMRGMVCDCFRFILFLGRLGKQFRLDIKEITVLQEFFYFYQFLTPGR